MKPLVPPLGTTFLLTKDFWIQAYFHQNTDLMGSLLRLKTYVQGNHNYYQELRLARESGFKIIIPAGSQVQVNRYHLGKSEERISLKVLQSPEATLRRKTLMCDVASFNELEGDIITV